LDPDLLISVYSFLLVLLLSSLLLLPSRFSQTLIKHLSRYQNGY
jgi:hypothetical protein